MLNGSLLFFILALLQSPLLGPVDGRDLPPLDLERVRLGEAAPDFRLADDRGKVHQLSTFRGQKNIVLVFYRGHW